MNLSKIGFIMLGTTDMDRSAAFYRDKLGLAVQTQFPGFTFFDGGGVTLALSSEICRASDHVSGATEVVFSVPGVREAHAALAARGVAFLNEPRQVAGPMWAAAFADPDGHKLSVFGPESAA